MNIPQSLPGRLLALLLGLACALAAHPAGAQLHLPSLPLRVPAVPLVNPPLDPAALLRSPGSVLDPVDLQGLRQRTVEALLHQHRDVLERDPAGELAVRGEILAYSPAAALLTAARASGFEVVRESRLAELDASVVVLRAPAGLDTAAALARLRALDANGDFDFNHVYTESGAVAAAAGDTGAAAGPVPAPVAGRVGLIDGGVDVSHVALRRADLQRWGCGGDAVPDAHGTAVASLMVGAAGRFRGVAPGSRLYAADVYCGAATGGAADGIAAAFAWLAGQRVGVINVSLVGPANRTLERVVRAMIARGHLIVAAVGNDGPAAPPLYPAAYPGVIGVTATDGRQHVLPEAARGPQVMFAAPGADVVAAASGGRAFLPVRGTSFASPVVAAMLSGALPAPDVAGAQRAVAELAAQAGSGLPGAVRDPEVGYGVVGEQFRNRPS